MPTIGSSCHELRITDETAQWRLIYRLDEDAIVIVEVFQKKGRTSPHRVVQKCKLRLGRYDSL